MKTRSGSKPTRKTAGTAKKAPSRPRRRVPPTTARTLTAGGPSLAAPTALFDRIAGILEQARARAVRAVNSEMVVAYWQIGREIVEHLQQGATRADYGDQLLQILSDQLNARFGRGYSVSNLRYFRPFYQAFADREPTIRHFAVMNLRLSRSITDAVMLSRTSPERRHGHLAWRASPTG